MPQLRGQEPGASSPAQGVQAIALGAGCCQPAPRQPRGGPRSARPAHHDGGVDAALGLAIA
eukprot:3833347-Alexandrium_andersonii.AAC.1